MKTCLRYILIMMVLASSCSMSAVAKTPELKDTVYFYQTWQQVFDLTPVVMLVDPYIEISSLLSIRIMTDDDAAIDKLKENGFIAVSLGDSIWYANSNYLKNMFKCDSRAFDDLVPLFYNRKLAYVTCLGEPSFKDVLFARDDEVIYPVDYYYIDFNNKRIRRVTHQYLSELLEDYHDLQMRYEGMKDYKKRYIIEDYFFKYIERATDDFLRPEILDIVK